MVALVTFPGRATTRSRPFGVALALAVPVALHMVPQPWVAALFTAVAAISLASWRTSSVAAYPAVGAAAVAAVLIWSWLRADRGTLDVDRSTVVRGYELVMASVAFGYLGATHVIAAGRERFTDRVLGHSDLTGLDGLAAVLHANCCEIPELEILRWHGRRRLATPTAPVGRGTRELSDRS